MLPPLALRAIQSPEGSFKPPPPGLTADLSIKGTFGPVWNSSNFLKLLKIIVLA